MADDVRATTFPKEDGVNGGNSANFLRDFSNILYLEGILFYIGSLGKYLGQKINFQGTVYLLSLILSEAEVLQSGYSPEVHDLRTSD